MKTTAAAVVLLMLVAASAQGQCVSSVKTLSARGFRPRFLAGPTAWSGRVLAVAGSEIDHDEFQILLFDEHGNVLAPATKIASPPEGLLDVVWNGEEFGVFYITDGDRLGLTRIDSEGNILSQPRTLIIQKLTLAEPREFDVVWSSAFDAYVIAHSRIKEGERLVRATWIRRNGEFVEQREIGTAILDSVVRIALASSGTIGIFYENVSSAIVKYVAIRESDTAKPVTAWSAGTDVLATERNDQFALLRTHVLSDAKQVVRWQVIDSSGRILVEDSFLPIGTGGSVEPISLLGRDAEFALSYLDWADGIGVGKASYRLARFSPEGTLISDLPFAAATPKWRYERTDRDFEWTGEAYMSLVSEENEDDDDTFLLRLCPLQAEISGPRSALPSQSVTFTALTGGGVPEYTYSWTVDGSASVKTPSLNLGFPAEGVHEITLTVKDASDAITTDTFLIRVGQPRRRALRK